jgi:hypothetical protein
MSQNGYSVTLKIEPTATSGTIGHAFITLSAPGRSDITVGFYPADGGSPYGVGAVRDDSVSKKTPTELESHDFMWSKTFTVTESQYLSMVTYAAKQANNGSVMYNGVGGLATLLDPPLALYVGSGSNVCTDFARGVLEAGGIQPLGGNITSDMIPQ